MSQAHLLKVRVQEVVASVSGMTRDTAPQQLNPSRCLKSPCIQAAACSDLSDIRNVREHARADTAVPASVIHQGGGGGGGRDWGGREVAPHPHSVQDVVTWLNRLKFPLRDLHRYQVK